FFFFQAEDGIRDLIVTGVQTCALPIYEHRDFSLIDITSPAATKGRALAWRAGELGVGRDEVMAVGDNFNDLEMLEYAGCPVVMRSEERRVGKECRSRGARYDEKKK